MEDALLKELQELREENEILRNSLTELHPGTKGDGVPDVEDMLRGLTEAVGQKVETAKEKLEPGKEKVTTFINENMEENPAPMMLTAFGVGYLLSRGLKGR